MSDNDEINEGLDAIKDNLLGALSHALQLPKNESPISESAKGKGLLAFDRDFDGSGYGLPITMLAKRVVTEGWQRARATLANAITQELRFRDAETDDLRLQLAEAKAREDKMVAAINWACGCNGDFVPTSDKPFWWRRGLCEKAGLTYSGKEGKYIFAETEGGQ